MDHILFETLAQGRSVALPGVGTLTVERMSAEFVSNRSLRPPFYKVVFTPQVRTECRSLGDEAGYAAWLKATEREKGVRDFGSAGVLRDGVFEMSPALFDRLNPQGTHPVALHPNCSVRRPAAVVAGVLLAAVIVWWIGRNVALHSDVQVAVSVHTERAWDAECFGEAGEPATEAVPEMPAADTLRQDTLPPGGLAEMPVESVPAEQRTEPDGRPLFHVVVGVFSEEANADKLIASDPLAIGRDRYRKVAFRSGKLLVSAFASTEREEADSCRRALSRRSGELWVYEQR